ncbi:hypothetical protein F1559_000681 [Cyanidiococcus yangmingshanensis]|uniref:Uncharacterized protein n=1 Tax=Cyanidiococcus yangmingshanensis TaxID=2690220 RepID=A0A7J7IE85_9RHOD|nr:hypothetical protein F1559_000681 [Cyanidiococcus yangmingshanensis]
MESSSMAAAAAAAAAAASPNTMPVEQRPLEHERTVHLVACLHRCFAEKQSSVVQQAERVCLALLALAPDHLLPSDLEQALETYPLLGRLLNQWPRTQAVLAAFVPLLSLDGGMALWLRHCSMEALRNAPENAHPRLAERTLQFLDTCVRSTESSLVAWQQALLLVPTPTSGALYILVKRLETLQDRVQVKQPLVRRAAAQLWETLRTRLQPAHWASLTGVAAAGVASRTPAGTALAPAHQTSPVANRHRLHYRLGAGTTKPEELESPQRQPPETPLQAHSPATGNHQPVVVWDSLDTLRQARLFWRDKAVGIDVTETVYEACTQARTLLAVAAQTDHDQAWLESALRTAIELVRHIGQALARSPPSPALTSADASPHPSTDPANALASEVLAGLIHWAIGVRQQAKIGSLLAVSANRLYRAVQSTYRQYGQPSPDAACI